MLTNLSMPIQYLVIGEDMIVNANNRLYVDLIDADNVLKRFVNVNETEHKLVIHVNKLVHSNKY